MQATEGHPARFADGTAVRVTSPHFVEECEGIITQGHFDEGWFYRIEVTAGDRMDKHRHDDGELWVCDFEVQPIESKEAK